MGFTRNMGHIPPTMLGVAVVVAAASAGASSADSFYELGVGIADATGPITDVGSVPPRLSTTSFCRRAIHCAATAIHERVDRWWPA